MTAPENETPKPAAASGLSIYAIYLAILLLALYPRLIALTAAIDRPLEGDAQHFLRLAFSPVSLWSASEREPFFILLHRMALLSLDNQPWAIRLQSMVFSLLIVWLVTAIALRMFKNKPPALVPGLIMALTPYLAFQATRGLRLELFVFLSMALTAVLTLPRETPSWPKAVVAGLIAAALCLTRQVGVMVALAVFALFLVRAGKKHGIKSTAARIGLAAALALLISAPFYFSLTRTSGSAFSISAKDAAFWRNQEFRDRPGFPTSAELRKSPYAGPRVTPYQYLFKMHSPSQVAGRILKGYALTFTFFYRHALGGFWWLLLLAAPGVIILCLRGFWEWVFLFALLILPFAFILPLSVVGHSSVDARFAMHGYPLVALFIGTGIDWLYGLARNYKRPERADPGS